ncbi:glycosyltransferase family 2 protein [candidate division WOR-3 bacterium]|nr:glycosyltransferase family 2 protein [candidate division WOR-3 bacterium]
MKLSVIIVNYNTEKFLEHGLSSIYLSPPNFDFEIMVVDNASKDGCKKLIREKFPEVRFIQNTINVGFARANNQAAVRAKGEYILFLNPDAIPKQGALDKIVKFMDENPYAGCVGGKLLYPDGRLQLSCRSFPTYISVFFGRQSLFRKFFPGNPFSKGFLLTDIDYNRVQKVDWVIGACILTKREVLEQFGYFSEEFFLFVEDLDFCYRLKKMGLDIYYFPDAVFYHYHGVSTRKYWFKSTVYHNLGMYKFFNEHYNLGPLLKPVAAVGLLLRIFCIVIFHSIIKKRAKYSLVREKLKD